MLSPMRKNPIRLGDTVRLSTRTKLFHIPEGREDHATAVVQAVNLYDCGGVKVNRDLNGMMWWNEEDLAIVKRAKKC